MKQIIPRSRMRANREAEGKSRLLMYLRLPRLLGIVTAEQAGSMR